MSVIKFLNIVAARIGARANMYIPGYWMSWFDFMVCQQNIYFKKLLNKALN